MELNNAITTAAMEGDTATVQAMLDNDPSLVNTFSDDGWTPLHLAAHFGHHDTVTALLDAGADIHARSRNDNGNHPLHAAAASKQSAVAATLIARGADVNATQEGGFTPLHSAAQNGDLPLAQLLLANGADINARHPNGQSPLDLARAAHQEAMVAYLQAQGGSEV